MTSADVAAPTVEYLEARDGTPLALHAWCPDAPQAVIFYLHGIQSHAGWLFQTGPELGRRRVGLYVLDRRGSGQSGGSRGDVPSVATLLEDYAGVAARVAAHHPGLPFVALGQSLGGGILAGLVATGRFRPDALLFCAPAIAQVRAKLSPEQRAEILAREESLSPHDVGLQDTDYTSLPEYLEFMKRDPLMLREITGRARAAFYRLELLYEQEGGAWPRLPSALIMPRQDPIIRLEAAKTVLSQWAGPHLMTCEFPCTEHYLEFSPARVAYWNWVAAFAKSRGWTEPC